MYSTCYSVPILTIILILRALIYTRKESFLQYYTRNLKGVQLLFFERDAIIHHKFMIREIQLFIIIVCYHIYDHIRDHIF